MVCALVETVQNIDVDIESIVQITMYGTAWLWTILLLANESGVIRLPFPIVPKRSFDRRRVGWMFPLFICASITSVLLAVSVAHA